MEEDSEPERLRYKKVQKRSSKSVGCEGGALCKEVKKVCYPRLHKQVQQRKEERAFRGDKGVCAGGGTGEANR